MGNRSFSARGRCWWALPACCLFGVAAATASEPTEDKQGAPSRVFQIAVVDITWVVEQSRPFQEERERLQERMRMLDEKIAELERQFAKVRSREACGCIRINKLPRTFPERDRLAEQIRQHEGALLQNGRELRHENRELIYRQATLALAAAREYATDHGIDMLLNHLTRSQDREARLKNMQSVVIFQQTVDISEAVVEQLRSADGKK